MNRWAVFDPERRWRYVLGREWAPALPTLAVVGLNPSFADHLQDDPTTRREVAFAARWGFGRLLKVNLFAFVSTDPMGLTEAADPIGPDNDRHIITSADEASLVLVAWGNGGELYGRDLAVTKLLGARPLKCLGRTKDGQPRHPLYLKSETPLEDWRRP